MARLSMLSDATVGQMLADLASGLRIVREGPVEVQPGQRVTVRLDPAPAGLTVPDVIPVLLPLPDNPELKLTGTITGLVSGSIPLPIQVPVDVDVEWSVRTDDGNAATAKTLGRDFTVLSPKSGADGLKVPEVTFLFPPVLKEPEDTQAGRVPRPEPAFIHARVTLTTRLKVGDAPVVSRTHTADLPGVPVLLPILPLPTALVLFRHPNFLPADPNHPSDTLDTPDGFALVVFPATTALKGLVHLLDVLDTVAPPDTPASALSTISSLAPARLRLLLGLRKLAAALRTQPHVKVMARDRIDDLNAITMIDRIRENNDIEGHPEVSSLIYVGPDDLLVRLFNESACKGENGELMISTGGIGIVVIRDLHSALPLSETGGNINVTNPPAGFHPKIGNIRGFGDSVRSLRFDRAVGGGVPST